MSSVPPTSVPPNELQSRSVSKEILLIESTRSHQLFEDLLTTYYIPLEIWYTRTIIDKVIGPFFSQYTYNWVTTILQAHRLSNPDMSQSPATTTTPDDVFYILKIVLSRLVSIGSVRGVERTFERLRDVMERDYASVIKKRLDDVYRTTGNSGPAVRGEKAERDNRAAFIVSTVCISTGEAAGKLPIDSAE